MTPNSSITPLPTDLLGFLWHLEQQGWDYKLTSTVNLNGSPRRFVASVWKSDALGGSVKCHAARPVPALAAALQDAQYKRHRRAQRRRERDKAAGL